MFVQFFTIGSLMLLSAMLPGPDFVLVIKNTLSYSRRAGIFTSLGIGCAILIHITYCALGLAIVISQSILLFNVIKYIGACYLIYLGFTLLLSKPVDRVVSSKQKKLNINLIQDVSAFRQGFLCNLLNPKATLFFLALFTVVIKPETPFLWQLTFAIEMVVIVSAWFCSLTLLLSHAHILRLLNKVEKYISKILGAFLVVFGVALSVMKAPS